MTKQPMSNEQIERQVKELWDALKVGLVWSVFSFGVVIFLVWFLHR